MSNAIGVGTMTTDKFIVLMLRLAGVCDLGG